MPENFQEDHTRNGEDANEAFERLFYDMKKLSATMLRLESALRIAAISFGYARDVVLRLSTIK